MKGGVAIAALMTLCLAAYGVFPKLKAGLSSAPAAAPQVAYEKGQGVPQDYGEAVKWFQKAADQGYANAQYNLGVIYDQGLGVPPDLTCCPRHCFPLIAGSSSSGPQPCACPRFMNGLKWRKRAV